MYRKILVLSFLVFALSGVNSVYAVSSQGNDLGELKACYYKSATDFCAKADFNGDGTVNAGDLGLLKLATGYDTNSDGIVDLNPSGDEVVFIKKECVLDGKTCDLKWDLNSDGSVTNTDAVMLSRMILGLSPYEGKSLTRFDLNGDGVIDVNSPYVKVKSPNGGEEFKYGEATKITWDSVGVDKVSIGWSVGQGSLNWIATNIPNSGSYDWEVIPGNMLDGQSKEVKIQIIGYMTGTGSKTDDSDGYFTVKKANESVESTTNLELRVDPNKVLSGGMLKIRWNNTSADYYMLGVGNCDSGEYTGGKARPNLCTESERIPGDGKDVMMIEDIIFYNTSNKTGTVQLKLVSYKDDQKVQTDSVDVTIVPDNEDSTEPIKVILPNAGGVYEIGDKVKIRWKGKMQAIRIFEVDSRGEFIVDGYSKNIVEHYNIVDDSGVYYWVIDEDIPAGSYKIQVEGCCGEIGGFDDSDRPINIVENAHEVNDGLPAGIKADSDIVKYCDVKDSISDACAGVDFDGDGQFSNKDLRMFNDVARYDTNGDGVVDLNPKGDEVTFIKKECVLGGKTCDLKWDLNGDGKVTNSDAVLLSRMMMGLSPYEGKGLKRFDLNGDGVVDHFGKTEVQEERGNPIPSKYQDYGKTTDQAELQRQIQELLQLIIQLLSKKIVMITSSPQV